MSSPRLIATRWSPKLVVFVLGWMTLSGCGKDSGRVEVSGQVVFDGQPIETGSIALVPIDVPNGNTAGGNIVAGTYTIPAAQGPLPGKYRVEIKAMRKTGKQITTDMHPGGDNKVAQIEQFIPTRYNTQSTLTAEIKGGPNVDVNFALTTK